MKRANIFLEASRLEITQCPSMRGFQKGVKFLARIPSNKRPWTVATSRSNGSGRVRHSWKSSNSKTFPSNLTERMLKTSIWWAGKKDGKCLVNAVTGEVDFQVSDYPTYQANDYRSEFRPQIHESRSRARQLFQMN